MFKEVCSLRPHFTVPNHYIGFHKVQIFEKEHGNVMWIIREAIEITEHRK